MKKRSAFTLVELLVVIAIISVLAAMLLPTLSDALEQGRRVVCSNNQKQLYLGLSGYASDFADNLPPRGGWWNNANTPERDSLVSYFRSAEESSGKYYRYQLSWARDYCGAEFTNMDAWNVQFANPASRGPFQCPSASAIPGNNTLISYRLSFAPSIRQEGTPYRPKIEQIYRVTMSKAAQPAGGFQKAFFFDNLWDNVPAFLGTYNPDYNSHRPGRTDGQNVAAGDGSVKWNEFSPFESTGAYGHPRTRVPRDYWAPVVWSTVRSDTGSGGFTLYDPTHKSLVVSGTGTVWYFRDVWVNASSNQTTWNLFNQLVRQWN